MAKTEIQKTEKEKKNEVATYGDLEITGLEEVEATDLQIPSLTLVQKSSTVLDNYPEAIAGGVIDNVSNEPIDIRKDPLVVIPLIFKRSFEVYSYDHEQDKEKYEGIIFELPPEAEPVEGTHFQLLPDGTRAYEKFSFLVVNENFSPYKIGMKRTKLKVAKKWLSMMKFKGKNVPAFAYKYRISSVNEEYNNHKYFNYSILPGPQCTEDEFQCAYELAKGFKAVAEKIIEAAGEEA